MHLASLSSELNISINELRSKAKAVGIHIPPRAMKVDNQTAKELLTAFGLKQAPNSEKEAVSAKTIALPEVITVRDLADSLKQPVAVVVKKLLQNGVLAGINESLDFDTAAIIAGEFGFEVNEKAEGSVKPSIGTVKEVLEAENEKTLETRPPIIAVMGHVDHGKTTLLDAIRQTNVAGGESGGITQHIGAYSITYNGKKFTFLDTPGHEAFATMRARGASVTDIIILVVAADDGVRPQTIEVINRAKFAKIPMVVAINKMDAPGANTQKVLQELATAGVLVEAWGGTTLAIEISARNNQGIDKLLEAVALQAEILEIKANPNGQMVATVIETHTKTGQGVVATVVVQNGTLKIGDIVTAGQTYGRIKNLTDDLGKKIKNAGPGMPVQITGLSGSPEAGDILCAHETLDTAKTQAQSIARKERSKRLLSGQALHGASGEKEMAVVIKADVAGSLEAIKEALEPLKNEEVRINIIEGGLGDVTDSDILRAKAGKAEILAFRVKASPTAIALSKQHKVKISKYEVIYELIADATDNLLKLCTPEYERTETGKLEVLKVFRTEKDFQIIGGKVKSGEIKAGLPLTLVESENGAVFKITELQQNKTLVQSVNQGYECGMKISGPAKIQEGDILINFTETLKKKTVSQTTV